MKHRGLKILSLLLALALLVGALPGMTAFADVQTGHCGDNVMWSYDTTTYTLTISGSGAMEDYNNSPKPWNNVASQIKTVVITDGVTSIGDSAFSLCSNLTSVSIPGSVTSIGENAFTFCRSLASISIPGSVTSIGDSAFIFAAA